MIGNCVTLQGELGPRDIVLPRDAVFWNAGKDALVAKGMEFSLDQMMAVAGGSIDRAEALADPAFEFNDCAESPLIFVMERVYGKWPPSRP